MIAWAHTINVGTKLMFFFLHQVSSECVPRKMLFRAKPFRRHLCQAWWKGNHSLKIKKMKIKPEQVSFSQLLQILKIRKDYQDHRA